jgi:hypothetical protein
MTEEVKQQMNSIHYAVGVVIFSAAQRSEGFQNLGLLLFIHIASHHK